MHEAPELPNQESMIAKPTKGSQNDQNEALIGRVADWLMDQALGPADDFEAMFDGCCKRLSAAGVPLWRGHITFQILHPLYGSMGLTWHRGSGVTLFSYPHSGGGNITETFKASPFYHMIRSGIPYLRRHLVGNEAILDFPVFGELRDQGGTDYFGFLIYFGDEQLDGVVGSWITDRPEGFTDQDIKSLLRVQKRLGVACKMLLTQQIARNVVTTYLGNDAGLRVLHGQIRRGDGERIPAVIWYADLRGSSSLADALGPDDFIACLNEYFECVGGAVMAGGGEILNFIGDAVLAIFPVEAGKRGAKKSACKRALKAGFEAENRMARLNQKRQAAGASPLAYGLALHLGSVVFGNIGLPERLSFSVIGPTVNEVARLEALTKELSRPILASASFARHTAADWESLGRHKLRGIGEPIEVMAPLRS